MNAPNSTTDEDGEWSTSSQSVMAWAETQDLVVVIPTDFVLMLDLDTQEQLDEFREKWPKRKRSIPHSLVHWTESKSGGVHVYIQMTKTMPILERLLLQCSLGSDRTKEYMSWLRIQKQDQNPSLMLEKNPIQFNRFDNLAAHQIGKKPVAKMKAPRPTRRTTGG